MAVLQPCATCWFTDKGCARKVELAAKIRGLGLTVARFPCAIQGAEYRPGRRVRATIRSAMSDAGPYGEEAGDVVVDATVIERSSKPGRFVIWPDPDTHEDLDLVKSPLKLCALRSRLLEPLDEPDRPDRVAELRALDQAQDTF